MVQWAASLLRLTRRPPGRRWPASLLLPGCVKRLAEALIDQLFGFGSAAECQQLIAADPVPSVDQPLLRSHALADAVSGRRSRFRPGWRGWQSLWLSSTTMTASTAFSPAPSRVQLWPSWPGQCRIFPYNKPEACRVLMMATSRLEVRLPDRLSERLDVLASSEGLTKTDSVGLWRCTC